MIFCSLGQLVQWLQNHLLPCPLKYLTGIDCPGCGFQRSVIALLKGNLKESLHLYPAAIPFILTALFVAVDAYRGIDNSGLIKKTAYLITGNIMLISYVIKLYHLYA
ncbi:uncharacterized protein DUF2752 [Mucilaginibacter yixingensis]|uniref:Uncharacterized protein DUF2752 n=1 Tax=Mucilaginibacter yixingensis TaxID=1295612 RepID=A0A2T5JCM4_9SPHI|nr:DUF2752 domain-containing protein [Mucilaginibacter yixingensis]PTQ99511.1 uncharacterized protein DUF2752 [Mucilaginibacter yixingensis]